MLPGGLARSAVSVVAGHLSVGFPVSADSPEFSSFLVFCLESVDRSLNGAEVWFYLSAFPFLWPFGLSVLFEWLASSSRLYWSHNVRVEGQLLEFCGGKGGAFPFRVVESNRSNKSFIKLSL